MRNCWVSFAGSTRSVSGAKLAIFGTGGAGGTGGGASTLAISTAVAAGAGSRGGTATLGSTGGGATSGLVFGTTSVLVATFAGSDVGGLLSRPRSIHTPAS